MASTTMLYTLKMGCLLSLPLFCSESFWIPEPDIQEHQGFLTIAGSLFFPPSLSALLHCCSHCLLVKTFPPGLKKETPNTQETYQLQEAARVTRTFPKVTKNLKQLLGWGSIKWAGLQGCSFWKLSPCFSAMQLPLSHSCSMSNPWS